MSKADNVFRRWFDFEQMRKKCCDLLKDIELSNFATQYGAAKTEAEFRGALENLATLISRMTELLGPPTEPQKQAV